MATLPSIFETCTPRAEILAGTLPDAIFAADLWDVLTDRAHQDYSDPKRFFAGTYPTDNLKLLLKDVAERLSGVEGGNPVFRLETGFGGGKTHSLIGATHLAKHGSELASDLADWGIRSFPVPGDTKVAAFVGENSDPLRGVTLAIDGQQAVAFTPWGQIALMAGGMAGYEEVKEHDVAGIAPSREALEKSLGSGPRLILIDELVLYMAKCAALPEDQQRRQINGQWPTFFQTLFSVAARRPGTVVILTLPSERDANRRLTSELKQHLPSILEVVNEMEQSSARQARNLTPTQSTERAAVMARRLFDNVDSGMAATVANAFVHYYEEQKTAGVVIDSRAFDTGYAEQIRVGYPFHPEFIRLFAERLADIPEFQATRGALRLVARTVAAAWANKRQLRDTPLLQPQHVDLNRTEIRDEVLARLGRGAFERGLEVDVMRPEGGTHANNVEAGWPWKAATESAQVVFLHSLPEGSRGLVPPEVALAVGRPGIDLQYVSTALEQTEKRAWYMRREGEHYLFRTRASVNKRYQERLGDLQSHPGEIRETLDQWVQDVFTGFRDLQVVLFPQDHTAITDQADRIRLAVIHYDKECGAVGGGDRLNFARKLFSTTGVNESPRRYRNNLMFLLAESSRVAGLKDAVRSLIAWERVRKDIEEEEKAMAQASGADFRTLRDQARRGATGVPAEFLALESDLGEVLEKLGPQELNVRSKLLEAYRIISFPKGHGDADDLFAGGGGGPILECYRVDFGEVPDGHRQARRSVREAVEERPILQCLRQYQKLVPEATPDNAIVLAPAIVKREPLWKSGEKKITTEEVWDRIRREPDLPMVLRQTDLLPTFRAGLAIEPDGLWLYYNQAEKRVYGKDGVTAVSPVIAANQYLYDPVAAVNDCIIPVVGLTADRVWQQLWLRDGSEHAPSTNTLQLAEAIKQSAHFPVLPERSVLWQALQEGARENRWVLYLRGGNIAIGAQEMGEWPNLPRIDETTELWSYPAALDAGIYPRAKRGATETENPISAAAVKTSGWPSGTAQVTSEDLERFARNIWPGLSRTAFQEVVREGVSQRLWGVWKTGADETFHVAQDSPPPYWVGNDCVLVDLDADLANQLDSLRPGRGPQPVEASDTPRQALTHAWDSLGSFPGIRLARLELTVNSREALDNTLRATWADRPTNAKTFTALSANGQREIDGTRESVSLSFEGRFEEVATLLSPIWPFQRSGDLDVTVTVSLSFDPPVALSDPALDTYRTAVMNANQGMLHLRAIPARKRGAA